VRPITARLSSPSLFVLAGMLYPNIGAAQDVADAASNDATKREIVVTAERIKGTVATSVAPIDQLDEADIAALGASSITDVVAAVAPQAASGRGRGGGAPVILLNGQRISGFRELRDLPPEAVKQVQIFPEEVALQYGYRPDQRVINFILKGNFASVSAEIETGIPQDGGYTDTQFETTFTHIGKSTRLNLNAEYQHSSSLTEKERGILRSSDAVTYISGNDVGLFRTLLPQTGRFEVNGTFSKSFAPQTILSLNANYRLDNSEALLGLPSANLLLPATSPFSQTGTDAVISRSFLSPRALQRDSAAHTANFGFSFNTLVSGFRWTVTGDYARVSNRSLTTRNADFRALQQGLIADTINPFAGGFGDDLLFIPPDINRSVSGTLTLANILSGTLFSLPSGKVQVTFRNGFNSQALDSVSLISSISANTSLRRSDLNGSVNIEIPLVDRGVGALGFLGEVSVNGNYGLSELSDFGRLTEYTAGIRWSPVKGLGFQATLIADENAPNINQLGGPLQTTPNVSFFDFARGQTALINLTSGGNSALLAEKRRDLKLSVNWEPQKIEGLNLQIEYFRNRSSNTAASFPLLTPEIEAAFPGRVSRDISGRLISLDRRPVNFDEERSQSVRSGFNFSGNIGQQSGRGGGPPRFGNGNRAPAEQGIKPERPAPPSSAPSGPQSKATDAPASAAVSSRTAPSAASRPAAGFARGGFGGPSGGGSPSRWQISVYHTYQIQDEVLIRDGVPRLNLLDGSATSNLGGTPRHRVEVSGGLFYKGLGTRITGNYRSNTRADGNGLPSNSNLRFSALTTLDLRFFINLDERGQLTQKLPILKGSRISLRIDNALNDIIDVRDQNGNIPISYLTAFLDPKGRYFEISFRKRF
jgi:iron complex outermembrane recepter protein